METSDIIVFILILLVVICIIVRGMIYNYANNNHVPANNWQIATTINRSSLGTSQIEAVDAYTHATLFRLDLCSFQL